MNGTKEIEIEIAKRLTLAHPDATHEQIVEMASAFSSAYEMIGDIIIPGDDDKALAHARKTSPKVARAISQEYINRQSTPIDRVRARLRSMGQSFDDGKQWGSRGSHFAGVDLSDIGGPKGAA